MFAPAKLLAAAAMFFIGLPNASANLITNGDFETGTFAGWTTFTTANGTTSADVTVGPNATKAATFRVGQVNYDGYQQGGGIRQVFFSDAGSATIAVDIAASTEGDGSDSVNYEGGVFQLLLDSIILDTLSFDFILGEETKTASLSYTGLIGAGLHELSILVTRPYMTNAWTPRQYLDNVVVSAAPWTGSNQVPEPGTVLLVAAGMAGLVLLRRRRGHESS